MSKSPSRYILSALSVDGAVGLLKPSGLLSEQSAKWLYASIFSPSCPYHQHVCVFSPQNKCKSSSSVYRVCTAKPITTCECTVSSITALGPFITSANLDISVRWLFTQSMRERDIFLSWIQTQVLSFNVICGHFNC